MLTAKELLYEIGNQIKGLGNMPVTVMTANAVSKAAQTQINLFKLALEDMKRRGNKKPLEALDFSFGEEIAELKRQNALLAEQSKQFGEIASQRLKTQKL